MSDYIVERLRACAQTLPNGYACAYLQEAADEIERLRSEVAKLEPYRAAQKSYEADNAYRERLEESKKGE